VVTEDTLRIHANRHTFLEQISSGESWTDSKSLREELISEWKGYSSAELFDLNVVARHFIEPEVRWPSREEIILFFRRCSAHHGVMLDLNRLTRVYELEALERLELEGPFKVPFDIEFEVEGRTFESWQKEHEESVTTLSDSEQSENAEALNYLKSTPKEKETMQLPTKLIEDDRAIIGSYYKLVHGRRQTGAIIVTNDFKTVVSPIRQKCLEPVVWIPWRYWMHNPVETKAKIPYIPGFTWEIFYDWGSYESSRCLVQTGRMETVPYTSIFSEVSSYEDSRPHRSIIDRRRVFRRRKYLR
jgi:hypothetical protein